MHFWICAVIFICLSLLQQGKSVEERNRYAIGFMHMASRGQSIIGQSKILVSSWDQARFETQKKNNYSKFWRVLAKGMWKYDFDPLRERATDYGKVQKKGAVLLSDQDICVQCVNQDFKSVGAYRAERLTPQSTEFYLPAYSVVEGNSVYAVVAAENDVKVTISVRDTASGKYLPSINVTLNKFDVYTDKKYGTDITGTYIKSNKPVAVYSSVDCAKVPLGTDYCDNMVVGVPPVPHLGTQFVVAPLADRGKKTGYIFRVISTQDKTTAKIYDNSKGGNVTQTEVTLSRGAYHEINYNSSVIAKIICSAPCMVVQYNKGHHVDWKKTDPFMLYIQPVEEFSNRLIWTVPEDRHGLPMYSFANIVVRTGRETGVRLDGKVVKKKWKAVPGGGFSVTTAWVYAGTHVIYHVDGRVKMGAGIYGHGIHEAIAYGFPACITTTTCLSLNGTCQSNTSSCKDGFVAVQTAGCNASLTCCVPWTPQMEPLKQPITGSQQSNTVLYQMLCLIGGILIGIIIMIIVVAVIWHRKKLQRLAGFSFGKFDNQDDAKQELPNGIVTDNHIVLDNKDPDIDLHTAPSASDA